VSEDAFLDQQYRALVHAVQDYAIFSLDVAGVVQTWNAGAERNTGYTSSEIVGQHFSRFYPRDAVAAGKPEAELATAARTGRFSEETWRLRRDGRLFWAHVVITPLHDTRDGSLRGFAQVTRDLTHWKAREDALRENREALAATLHSIGDGVIATDELGRVTRLNPVAERLTGWAHAEALGRPITEVFSIVSELTGQPMESPIARVLAEGIVIGLANHTALVSRDGTLRAIADSGAPIRDPGGVIRGAVLVFRDVTEERRAAEAMRKLEERFRILVSQVADYAIYMLDLSGRISSWNIGAERMKGYSEEEVLGQHFSLFYTPEDVASQKPARALEQAIAEGRSENEGWRLRKDGTRFWANAVLTALHADNGALIGFAKLTRDLTERQQTTARLLEERAAHAASESARARSAFLADLGKALAESRELKPAIVRMARLALPMLGDYCIVDLRTPDGQNELLALAHVDPTQEHLVADLRRLQVPESVATHPAPRVLATGKSDLVPVITDEMLVAAAKSPEYLQLLRSLHPTSHMIVPMFVGERPTGTVSFVSTRSDRHFNEVDLSLAEDLAHRAALVIDNARLYDAEQRARRAAEILARAGAVLGSSLDHEVTLQNLAQLAVPLLADWCTVHVTDESGNIRPLAVAHTDPEKVRWARELAERYGARPDEPRGVPNVLRTGKTELYRSISDEMLHEAARDAEHERILRELGMTSVVIVPLEVHGRTIGALSMIHAESGQHFLDGDVVLIEELARRAAIAVENARLYRESQRAIALRDEFMSIASHELRTPLTSLQLHVEGLLRSAERGESLGATRYLAKLKAVAQQVSRQERLVHELLDFSHVAAGGLEFQLEELDLSQLISEVAERFQEDLAKRQCPFQLDTGGSVLGTWDRLRMDQVVTNLLSNALKYAPGRLIHVRLHADEERATIDVIDQGPGVAPEDQERIFRRFERAVSGSNYGGFGLGLWLVREIVTRLGGSVSVLSQLGQGATFRVVVPRQPPGLRSSGTTPDA
jgi:PAS domain S-box-containing protein